MRIRILSGVWFLILLLHGSPWALAEKEGVDWPWQNSDLTPDPALIYGKLENGFRYLLYPNDHPAGRVHMHLLVRSGSRHEAEGQQGLAHYLEHMAFNGSTHFPPGSLVPFFQEIGMNFGGDTNAHTAFDRTVYDIVLPEGRPETIAKGLRIMADYAGKLLFLPEEIDRERWIILAEKRDRDSAAYRLHQAKQAFFLEGSRIPERPPIGHRSVILSAGPDDFRAFYDNWYRPDRMVLLVVGDMDPAAVKKEMYPAFGFPERGLPAPEEPPVGIPFHEGLRFFCHQEVGSGELNMGVSTVVPMEVRSHTSETEQEEVLRYIGMRILGFRLERLKEEGHLPALATAAFTYDLYGRIRMTDMRVICRDGNWEDALEVSVRTLRDALVHGFAPAELERVRRELIAWYEDRSDAAARQSSRELADELLEALYSHRVPVAAPAMAVHMIPFVKGVGLDQVNRVFRELWSGNHRLVWVTGEGMGAGPDVVKSRMRQRYLAAGDGFPPKIPWEDGAVFPYLPSPEERGRVEKVWEDPALGIRDVLFEDGTLLHVKATDFEAGRVRMRVRLGTGRSGEPWPGLSFVAAETLNLSGTAALTREDLDGALAGKRISLRMGMEVDHHYFDGEARKAELENLIHLLRARLEDPGFRQEALDLARDRYIRSLDQAKGSVERTFRRESSCFFTGGDTRICPPEAEAAGAWSLDAIRGWLAPSLKGDSLEISVVGDVDPPTVELLVARILGPRSLQFGQNAGMMREAPEFVEGSFRKQSVSASPPSSMVQWGFPTGGISSSLQHRGVNLLSAIMDERLREEIRENMAVAYAPFAWHWSHPAWPEWGGVMAAVSVAPEAADEVTGRIRALAAELGSTGVEPALLERVRGPLINSLKTRQQDNRYWLLAVLDGSGARPEVRQWARTLISDYRTWNVEDLSALANRILDPEKASFLRMDTENGERHFW
ncbi:insulinase family protein [Desulfobotulus sp. H1]|uniref:Insulinase family protein n=1 Tax=Desulfobotulus pelophilus TaxID=2823377 RepID=A0ABT3N4Y5_9BACT|nr:M16 family metallopeptidase [Desulfobotulus pelophilus]MCW7752504.1 insulinase family protein [Desulfobotulus pelophilus]